MEEGEDAEEEEEEEQKKSRSTWPGETASSKGSHDGEDGRVLVDLPNLGTEHVFILIELCFHCWGISELDIYRKSWGSPQHEELY